mmetsp:Transcript_31668/g.69208  ORF Transcript_31668/g.69208 Transcript_31668/m.69208 type:complete len:278 (+) Transcript_31668:508-1341(+)
MVKKSCHKCAGTLEKAHASTVAHCPVCRAGYHTIDCGMRYLAAGLDESDVAKCPKCHHMCACSGGGIPCHTANVRLRGTARKKRQSPDGVVGTCENDNGFIVKQESDSQAFGTYLGPNKRLKQQTKVPIVVGQLIKANRGLKEQVKQLQALLSQCNCLVPAAAISSAGDKLTSPKTPPEWNEEHASEKEWDGLFFSNMGTDSEGIEGDHNHNPRLAIQHIPPPPPPPYRQECCPTEGKFVVGEVGRCLPQIMGFQTMGAKYLACGPIPDLLHHQEVS